MVPRERKDFPQLVSQVVAGDKEAPLEGFALGEPSVAGKGDSVISTTACDKVFVVNSVVVAGIVAEYTKPASEATEHHVGEEFVTTRRWNGFHHDLTASGGRFETYRFEADARPRYPL